MNADNIIPDVFILNLERESGRLVILHENDYLLRRFGQVEHVRLKEGEETPFSLREVADEIWYLITGGVSLILVDKRQDSPSENQSMRIELSGTQPQSIMIPFGVAYQFKAVRDSELIRITTHGNGVHEDERNVSQDEIDFDNSTA